MLHKVTPRQYPIYEDSEQIGFLTFSYTQQGNKIKLSAIHDPFGEKIALSHLWINNLPAQHLKRLRTSILPEGFQENRHRKEGTDYYLDFDQQWSWFSKKRNIQELHLHVIWRENTLIVVALSCCKILGLKKLLNDKYVGDLKGKDQYLLYCNGRLLQDEMTLDEYGLEENAVLTAFIQADLSEGPTSLQMETGRSYLSIQKFEEYVAQMKERIDIVCQIAIPTIENYSTYGTGFLIGDFLLMTNAHVVENGLEGASAKFFYHGNDQREFEVEIDEKTVCESKSPGKNRRLNGDMLDYAILRLKPSQAIQRKQHAALQKLNAVAKEVFQKALAAFQAKEPSSNVSIEKEKKRLARANIIQHPLTRDSDTHELNAQPKQIAFRENRVHDYDLLILHYESSTHSGSSGSPVFNDRGDLIGLHFAECNVIQDKLYKHRMALCVRLGYTYDETESTHVADCFQSEQQHLYIFCSGKNKGSCAYEPEGHKKFSLRDLILENLIQLSLKDFILEFLLEQKEFKNEDHLYCNTAMVAENIFSDLQKNAAAKQHTMDIAARSANIEWEEFAESQKTFLEKYKWPIGAVLVMVVLAGAYCWRTRKK